MYFINILTAGGSKVKLKTDKEKSDYSLKCRRRQRMKKKATLHNLGCKVNAYETEAMRELLEEAGALLQCSGSAY